MKLKNAFLVLALALPVGLFGQSTAVASNEIPATSLPTEIGFKEFCLKESISYIEIPANKLEDISFAGEVASLESNPNSSHDDYGIELKEGETQYYKLKGSNKILSVKSLFVLRLNYTNSAK